MKNSKLVMIASILVIAIMSVSSLAKVEAAPTHGIYMTFRAAMENPDLVDAMKKQLDPDFLKVKEKYYTQVVYFDGDDYYITGTYRQWNRFFKINNDSIYSERRN